MHSAIAVFYYRAYSRCWTARSLSSEGKMRSFYDGRILRVATRENSNSHSDRHGVILLFCMSGPQIRQFNLIYQHIDQLVHYCIYGQSINAGDCDIRRFPHDLVSAPRSAGSYLPKTMLWPFGDCSAGSQVSVGEGGNDGEAVAWRLSSCCDTNSAELSKEHGNCWLSLRSLAQPVWFSLWGATERKCRPPVTPSFGRRATIWRRGKFQWSWWGNC